MKKDQKIYQIQENHFDFVVYSIAVNLRSDFSFSAMEEDGKRMRSVHMFSDLICIGREGGLREGVNCCYIDDDRDIRLAVTFPDLREVLQKRTPSYWSSDPHWNSGSEATHIKISTGIRGKEIKG